MEMRVEELCLGGYYKIFEFVDLLFFDFLLDCVIWEI